MIKHQPFRAYALTMKLLTCFLGKGNCPQKLQSSRNVNVMWEAIRASLSLLSHGAIWAFVLPLLAALVIGGLELAGALTQVTHLANTEIHDTTHLDP